MGDYFESDNIVLLLDDYQDDSQKLHTSFKQAGKNYPVAVIEDNGFLPDDVISVFGYFLGDFKTVGNHPLKPRYFNQIKVPEYWEISANNTSGKVHNMNRERARIFYAEPKHKRLVRVVDWLDERGVVRSSDFYNKHGALWARLVFNNKGQKVNKTYFSAEGKEIIVENYVTKDIILNDGETVRIFRSLTDFVCYFMEKSGFSKKRIFFNTLSTSFFVSQRMPGGEKGDVLFWQEAARNDIPGNMKIILEGRATRTAKIMVQRKAAYEKLLELGASASIVKPLGYIYSFKRENTGKPQVLICTNSDRIAKCKELVEALPQMHFHIAAITEMSSKLMSMEAYDNVTLYPGVKMKVADELFEKCDFYLDINHEGEILSAVQNAFLHNHLIFAFKETMHNASYVATEHIYKIDEADDLISVLNAVLADKELLMEHLKMQYQTAMLEKAGTYLEI